jgi:hypothetical protein
MLKVYLEGPPDNWAHGLATAKKLRLKYKPPETIYLRFSAIPDAASPSTLILQLF